LALSSITAIELAIAIAICGAKLSSQEAKPQRPAPVSGPSPILFAAYPAAEMHDNNGKPALAALDPIGFVSVGTLRECVNWAANENTVPQLTLKLLRAAYSPGKVYTLWWRGSPVGKAEAVSSCIGEDDIANGGAVDLQGCFRFKWNEANERIPPNSSGIAFTGASLPFNHPRIASSASEVERSTFLELITQAYANRGAAAPRDIRLGSIEKTELRAGHTAIVGNALLQIPAGRPDTYRSLRLFLVVEDESGRFAPVLSSFHEATIETEEAHTLNPGERLDEENEKDEEAFVDNFPLFPGGSDAVISIHHYYEATAYSVYRRAGEQYKLVYTGCGGGD